MADGWRQEDLTALLVLPDYAAHDFLVRGPLE